MKLKIESDTKTVISFPQASAQGGEAEQGDTFIYIRGMDENVSCAGVVSAATLQAADCV